MSSFLSVSKLWLSLLISMYCTGVVKEEDHARILAFITGYLLPKSPADSTLDNTSSTISGRTLLQEIEDFLVGFETTGTETENILQGFVRDVWRITNLDDLTGFIKELDALFNSAPGKASRRPVCFPVSKQSLLGMFIQRVSLEFVQLRFEHQMKLWSDFRRYQSALADKYRMDHETHVQREKLCMIGGEVIEFDPDKEIGLFAMIDKHNNDDQNDDVGGDELASMLSFQVDRMQRFGARLDPTHEKTLMNILTTSKENPMQSYYFNFLSSWYAGDYASSFECLHQYYDYAIAYNDRSQYHYACLNMAILHADFGCFEEALPAIVEAINAARESKDQSCLTFCLTWLYHFSLIDVSEKTQRAANTMVSSSETGLTYLRQQAREQKLYNLESSIILNQAKTAMAKGARPLETFERLHESSTINLEYDLSSVASSNMLVRSSAFSELGLQSISDAYHDLILTWYEGNAPVEEIMQASCRSAVSHAFAGQFEDALKVLESAYSRGSGNLKHMQLVSQYTGIIKLKQAIHKNDTDTAEIVLRALKGAPSPDPTLTWMTSLLEIDHHTRLRNFPLAFTLVEQLSTIISTTPITPLLGIHIRLKALIAKSRIFIAAARPQKALSLTLRAATAALKAKSFVILAESTALLAQVLNSLKCFEMARELLGACVEQAREVGDEELMGVMQETLADACVGLAEEGQQENGGVTGRDMLYEEAHGWLGKSLMSFENMQDLAHVAVVLGKDAVVLRKLHRDREAEVVEERVKVSRGGADQVNSSDWDFGSMGGVGEVQDEKL